MPDLKALTRQYFAALGSGATGETLARFYTEDVLQEEFPNRLAPQGVRRSLSEILAAAERGQRLMAVQRYEILHVVAEGNRVAVEFRWSGVLSLAVGQLPAGAEMGGHFASFIEFRDDKIAAQRSYDCFEAW